MILAKIRVVGIHAHLTECEKIPSGIKGAQVAFEYADPMWDEMTKTVVFKGAVTKDVLDAGDVVEIPSECVARPGAALQVGVYGTGKNGQATPTLWADLGRVKPAADPSGDPSTDGSLPVWAQLQEQIKDLQQGGAGGGSIIVDDDGYLTTTSGGFDIDDDGYILL